MVAHNVADVSLLFPLMVRRRAFFQEDLSIVSFAVWLFVARPYKVEVEPGFVVATLVSRADTKSFMVTGECAVLSNFHCPSELGGLRKPQTSAHLPGTAPGPDNGVGLIARHF